MRCRLRLVSNFGDDTHARTPNFSPRVASPPKFARMRAYFVHPTITIAKIRDYSQSK